MNQDNERLFIGEFGTLSADLRLQIPADIRRAVVWQFPATGGELMLELRTRGRLRLYQAARVADRLAAARKRLAEATPDAHETLAALGDRFRVVPYSLPDGRVRLTEAVVAYLRTSRTVEGPFYVEARVDHVDVLAPELREERLERLKSDLSVLDEQ